MSALCPGRTPTRAPRSPGVVLCQRLRRPRPPRPSDLLTSSPPATRSPPRRARRRRRPPRRTRQPCPVARPRVDRPRRPRCDHPHSTTSSVGCRHRRGPPHDSPARRRPRRRPGCAPGTAAVRPPCRRRGRRRRRRRRPPRPRPRRPDPAPPCSTAPEPPRATTACPTTTTRGRPVRPIPWAFGVACRRCGAVGRRRAVRQLRPHRLGVTVAHPRPPAYSCAYQACPARRSAQDDGASPSPA